MDTQANKLLHLPLWVGGIAAILVSSIAIGSLAISPRGFDATLAPAAPPEVSAAQAIVAPGARAYRCAECGVVESTREIEAVDEKTAGDAPGWNASGNRDAIEAKPIRSYEITIRLRDGSRRVITDAHPARWRHGERIQVIAGVD